MDRLKEKNKFDGSLKYGAKEFQKETGRDKPFGLKIFEKYGDAKTGLIKNEFVEKRGFCPLCSDKNINNLFLKHGLRYHLCNDCGFYFVDPILKDDVLMDFYKNEETWYNVLQSEIQQEMDDLKFNYGLDIIKNYKDKGTLLDIGSGSGQFIKIANKRDWNCSGIEFNSLEVEYALKEGLDIIQEELESPYFDNKTYDMICMWEVLEHLKHPREIVKRSMNLLNSGGLLFILVPNRDSLLNRILHEKSGSFTPHCHISMFNELTLCNLLIQEGFKILESETIISEKNNILNHLNYENAYFGNARNNLNFIDPKFIHSNMLGCKLLVLAEKILK